MSFYSAPWTDIGSLQQKADSLQSEMYRKADKHEMDSLRSKLGCLECSVRELSSSLDSLRSELEELRKNHIQALEVMQEVATVL